MKYLLMLKNDEKFTAVGMFDTFGEAVHVLDSLPTSHNRYVYKYETWTLHYIYKIDLDKLVNFLMSCVRV